MKYSKGQELKTNCSLAFPSEYDYLEKGSTFKIKIAVECLDYPYLVEFENGFEVCLNDEDITKIVG